jgi:hypothetical protein
MKSYNEMYLSIVVQNNDPEQRGRIKCWVPSISAVIYDKWNKLKKDRKFKFPGKNINSDLSGDIIDELKTILPWAEQSVMLMGATGSGRYHSQDNTATISDSNVTSKTQPDTATPNSVFTKYKLNPENIGEKPGRIYQTPDAQLSDGFTDTAGNKTKYVNKYGQNYEPAVYSNAAKGSFSIPNVGSHVWVFFREGNLQYPVYMGASFGQEDFRSIFNESGGAAQDYPGSYESKSKLDNPNPTVDSDIYRNKYVFNQKGGTIEIINTDKREALNLIHYSGSYLGFNNRTAVLFSANNFQSLILGNTFETFKGNKSLLIEKDFDFLTKGDNLVKIGNLNPAGFQAWYNIYTDIHNLKKLFEIQRVEQSGSFATISQLGSSVPSPSTQDGSWATQSSKAQIVSLIESKAKDLADAEVQMGRGGSEIRTITKHKIEAIGLVMNDYDSYRLDSVGKLSNYATTINSIGVWAEVKASPLVEYVDAENFPCGSLTQFIANKYKAIVGSGGYELKTTGPVDISGTIVNLVGKQLNVAAQQELTIDGGKRLNLIADIITLSQRAGKQVNIPTNFGVSKNTVIKGGMHVEGELSVQHISGPVEWQVTEPTHIKTTMTIKNVSITGVTQGAGANQDISTGTMTGEIELDVDHTHYFRNIALALLPAETDVRNDAAAKVNADSATARGHKAVADGKRGGGSMRPGPVVNGPNNNNYGDGTNTSD